MCPSPRPNPSVCELIPGRLNWAPCALVKSKGTLTSIGELTGEYRVPHYSREACGRAFGPLGLDETLEFCMKVQTMLSKLAEDVQSGDISAEEGVLSICTSSKSVSELTNGAVLVGAYLILFCEWKVDDVAAAIGPQDSSRLFICSWSRTELQESKRTLSVRNCWEGLHLALHQGWLHCVKENEYAIQHFLQEHTSTSSAYDASWIIPSQLLVCADPLTTIYDPNPQTVNALFPDDAEQTTNAGTLNRGMFGADGSPVSRVASSTSSAQSFAPSVPPSPHTAWSIESAKGSVALGVPAHGQDLYEGMRQKKRAVQILSGPRLRPKGDEDAPPMSPTFTGKDSQTFDVISACSLSSPPSPISPKSVKTFTSLETVNKEYKLRGSTIGNVEGCHMDFASFWKRNEVGLIVRANFIDESGMPPPECCLIYDREKFKSHGFCQVDVQFLDLHGAVPSRYQVHRMLRCCKNYMSGDGDVVVVHCKGGFGRSIVLAACLAIERFDIPGSALLGWIRIARPGSVNTIKQEQFLYSLRGRADVLRYAGGTSMFPMPACCGSS